MFLACALAALAAAGAQGIRDTYIAPDNALVFSMCTPDGVRREFQRDLAVEGRLFSLDGWAGKMSADGRIDVMQMIGDRPIERYIFDRGRLVAHQVKGEDTRFAYDEPRQALTNHVPPLAVLDVEQERRNAKEYAERELNMHWESTGRLAFPFVNPNQSGALYAELALLSLALLAFRRRGPRVAAVALFAAFCLCLLATGSRGCMLALAAGLCVFPAVHRDVVRRHARMVALALVVAACAVGLWFAVRGGGDLTRGFGGNGMEWSNRIRLDMWKAAPTLMVDAPGGWSFCGAGRAFFNWYQPESMVCLTGSLMNDHLTTLADFGWCGRCLYLAGFFAVLGLGLHCAWRRKDPVPLAVWIAFAVMAWFNPVFAQPALWVAPVVALWPVARVRWREERKILLAGSAGVAALSGLVLLALYAVGSAGNPAPGRPRIHADGRRVLVNGIRPKVWVVDDGRGAIGGFFTGRDIRSYYAVNPQAPSIGYVQDISELPAGGIDRLVLAGEAGADWLTRLSEDESARRSLPGSVVFISPSFSPSEVPEGVLKLCNPKIVVGEFAALYDREYAAPPAWVKVVPAMSRYVLMWMRFVLEG